MEIVDKSDPKECYYMQHALQKMTSATIHEISPHACILCMSNREISAKKVNICYQTSRHIKMDVLKCADRLLDVTGC